MRKKALISCLLLIGLLFSFHSAADGQNAPVTSLSVIGNEQPGQLVSVFAFVSGFNNIGSISLSLNYDFSKLQFISSTMAPQLLQSGNFSTGDNDLGTGYHRLITGWYGTGTSLQDSSWIINYIFKYISGNTLLEFYDNGGSCAYTDQTAKPLIDTPYTTFYRNGAVCGIIPDPGTISGNSTVFKGTGETYSINDLQNSSGYIWTLPAGAVLSSGTGTKTISVTFLPEAVSGFITVKGENSCGAGPVSSLPITVADIITSINMTKTYSGQADLPENDFQIFPNPARSQFVLKSQNFSGSAIIISIFSVNGILRKWIEIAADQTSENKIDISDLPSGTYLVQIKSGTRKVIRKLIII